MKKFNYIYFTFDTLSQYHIDKSIESLSIQDISLIDTITIYNNSTTFKSDELTKKFERFNKKIVLLDKKLNNLPSSKRMVDDINYTVKNIKNSDFYILHKADFCLPINLIKKSYDLLNSKTNPYFLNFSKYFLREDIVNEKVDELLKYEKFSDLLKLDFVAKSDKMENYSFKYRVIGYTGIDGGIHMYNEDARKNLNFGNFTDPHTWHENAKDMEMVHGLDDFYVLHMFHYIGRNENRYPDRGKIGHRF
jgi:hypothetical protein